MSVTLFSGMNCEFWKSIIIIMQIFAILEVLELTMETTFQGGRFSVGVLLGFFVLSWFLS